MQKNNDKFYSLLMEKIPYFENLTSEELQNLQRFYGEFQKNTEIWSTTMSRAINSKSDVDYTTSIDKAAERQTVAKDNLNNYVNLLNHKYGYVQENKETTGRTK